VSEIWDPKQFKAFAAQGRSSFLSMVSQAYGIYYRRGPKIARKVKEVIKLVPFNLSEDVRLLSAMMMDHNLPNKYMPIPVRALPKHEDFINYPHRSCPKLALLQQQYLNSVQHKAVEEVIDQDFVKALLNMTNQSLVMNMTWQQISDFYENEILLWQNGELSEFPHWVANSGLSPKLAFLRAYKSAFPHIVTDEMLRLASSPLYSDLVSQLEAFQGNSSGRELRLTVHASNGLPMRALLRTFGALAISSNFTEFVSQPSKINRYLPAGSVLALELFSSENAAGEYWVRMSVNGKPVRLRSPECQNRHFCALPGFIATLKASIYPDFRKACELGTQTNMSSSG
jgi:nicotinamide mononucleotide adenylyltransferase